MRKPILIALFLSGAVAACSGPGGGNASGEASGNDANLADAAGAATYDRNSEQGRAFRTLLECAATNESAKSQIGGETMFVQDEERDAMLAQETALRARSTALQEQMNAQGTALGLSRDAIMEEFNAHVRTFVHGPNMGTRLEYARSVVGQAETCGANYPGAAG